MRDWKRISAALARFGMSQAALWPAFGMTVKRARQYYSQEFPEIESKEFAALGFPVQDTDNEESMARHAITTKPHRRTSVRGPMVFTGYFHNDKATKESFAADGWFRTGDLGKLDEAGRLTLIGRSKDSVIVNGSITSAMIRDNARATRWCRRSYVAAFPTRESGHDTEQLVIVLTQLSAKPMNLNCIAC